jgi:transcriptional regulator
MDAKQRDFIVLRDAGETYEAIAKKLKTSKATLIQWSKLFQEEIRELQFHSFIKIKEAHSWNQKKKYEMLLKQLDKIDEGILDADLSVATLKDLFTIKNSILSQVESMERNISVNANVIKKDMLGDDEMLQMKLNEA